MPTPYETDVPGARAAFIVLTTIGALATGVYVAPHLGAKPEKTACQNPLLGGPYEMTIQADANLRTTPHRYDSIGANLAGEPLKKAVQFSTENMDHICISENAQGTWYGFKDNELSKVVDQKLEGNKQHWVWVNQKQNITSTPLHK